MKYLQSKYNEGINHLTTVVNTFEGVQFTMTPEDVFRKLGRQITILLLAAVDWIKAG